MNLMATLATFAAHQRRNDELCRTLADRGIDLEEARAAELHFWCPEQQDAALLAKALYQRGFLVLVIAPEQTDETTRWNVEAGLKEPVALIASNEFTTRMIELALEHASEYDGWGTSV